MATTTSTFIYKGIDKKGKAVQGQIQGQSSALVKVQLLKQGVRAKSVRKKSKPLFGSDRRAIKPLDMAIFTRQMATMMKAGVPLVQSFELVADGVDNKNLSSLILQIRDDVASGSGFANALRNHPKYFDDLFCNLVEAGEQSGTLETMLDRIATYKEKTESTKAKIKKAITYPIAVVVVAIIVTGILLVKVVPQFAETFSNFGAELPAFTLFVLGLSTIMQEWWYIFLFGLIAAFFLFKECRKRSKSFATIVDRYSLKIPIIGKILHHSIMARFARTLSTTFAAGVPLIEALDSVAGATGNIIYQKGVLAIKDEVATGIQLNQAMRSSNLFPTLVTQMTSIGEESGALDDMLSKVAMYYEESVDNMVDNLTTLLEPMIMVVLGVLVGGLMIAMYLPIFKLGSVV
jgi:type IV pilus assembly protein PilC